MTQKNRRPPFARTTRFTRAARKLRLETLEPRQLLAGISELAINIKPSEIQNPSGFIALAGTTFFTANEHELWKTDGTVAGTVLVKDTGAGVGAVELSRLHVHGTSLVFFKDDRGDLPFDSTDDRAQLWKSDGTTNGTVIVQDFGLGSMASNYLGSSGAYFSSVGGRLFFALHTPAQGTELWSTNNLSSAAIVEDIVSGTEGSHPMNLTSFGGKLYFTASDSSHGRELWVSDGTPAGTALVKDIVPGPSDSVLQSGLTAFAELNSKLYFGARSNGVDNIPLNADDTSQLWQSDGTLSGTVLVKDFGIASSNNGYGNSSNGLVKSGNLLFGVANTFAEGAELWKSDGTAVGTVLVKDINATAGAFGGYSSYISNLTDVGGKLFFSADDGIHGDELWTSDGTISGTVMVKDIKMSAGLYFGSGSYPYYLTNVGGKLYFVAEDDTNGRELWKSDGTESGTLLVKDLGATASPYTSSSPRNLKFTNGKLFFSGPNEAGAGLWVLTPNQLTVNPALTLADDVVPGSVPPIQSADVDSLFDEAIARWTATGLTPAQSTALNAIQPELVNLPQGELTVRSGNTLYIDDNAAGLGWFADPTPTIDEEFNWLTGGRELQASDPVAASRVDLLTAMMHELGHVLGLSDTVTPYRLLNNTLPSGVRRLPDSATISFAARANRAAAQWDFSEQLVIHGSLYENSGGWNERWIYSSTNLRWFFITPFGQLFRWQGGSNATSVQVAQLSPEHYLNPTLLTSAANNYTQGSPEQTKVLTARLQSVALDQRLQFQTVINDSFNWGGANERWLRDQTGRWYFIKPDEINNVYTLHQLVGGTIATSPVIAQLSRAEYTDLSLLYNANEIYLAAIPNDAPTLTAEEVDRELGLRFNASYYATTGGLNARWMYGALQRWYFLSSDGSLYQWTGSYNLQQNIKIAKVNPALHGSPALLHNAYQPPTQLVTLDTTLQFLTRTAYTFNWGGLQEKWLLTRTGTWYYIRPNGELYRWSGGTRANLVANSTLITTLGVDVYHRPHLLTEAAG